MSDGYYEVESLKRASEPVGGVDDGLLEFCGAM
jgi:hypothetical protein